MEQREVFKSMYWVVYLCGEQDVIKRILYFNEKDEALDTYEKIKKAMLKGSFAIEINDLMESKSIINLTNVLEVKSPKPV